MRSIALSLFLILFTAVSGAAKLLSPVYLTFEEEDTSTSITVNFMTSGDSEKSYVHFGAESKKGLPGAYPQVVRGRTGQLNKVDKTFHHVKLDNLTPNTTYYFIVGDSKIGHSREYKFRTLPNDDTPIRMLVGGDMGIKDHLPTTSYAAVASEPHVILIGGDIAYADGKSKNVHMWDQWFSLMSEILETPSGYLVPLIVAIGNHESTTGAALPWAKAPFYMELFPQRKDKSYFTRKLGKNAVLLVLDSGHLVTHNRQTDFIEREMGKYKHLEHRFALYHAPLYPSHRPERDIYAVPGKKHWLPLFDKYKLTTGFEHHDHTLKRTHVLHKNKVARKGTVYIGDGCWGKGGRETNEYRWYLAVNTPDTHVWLVDIFPTYSTYKASGKNGQVFDHFGVENTPTDTFIHQYNF